MRTNGLSLVSLPINNLSKKFNLAKADTSLLAVCCNKISFLKVKKKALGDSMSDVPNVAAYRIVG